jgi:hypothetical protein
MGSCCFVITLIPFIAVIASVAVIAVVGCVALFAIVVAAIVDPVAVVLASVAIAIDVAPLYGPTTLDRWRRLDLKLEHMVKAPIVAAVIHVDLSLQCPYSGALLQSKHDNNLHCNCCCFFNLAVVDAPPPISVVALVVANANASIAIAVVAAVIAAVAPFLVATITVVVASIAVGLCTPHSFVFILVAGSFFQRGYYFLYYFLVCRIMLI